MKDQSRTDRVPEHGDVGAERERMVRALALLDAGDLEEARSVLRDALGQSAPVAPLLAGGLAADLAPGSAALRGGQLEPIEPAAAFEDALQDDEIHQAIANAETNPDEMMSANKVVEKTLDAYPSAAPDASFDVAAHPTYATRSMAELLESQGRTAEADAVRAALPASEELSVEEPLPASDDFGSAGFGIIDAGRLRIVATLESWLHNVRRGLERDKHQAGHESPPRGTA